MKLNILDKPREFTVGRKSRITISDHGKILLDTNEMISFVTKSGKEFDVTAKEWGFYATPSMNGRLKNEGFKTALVKNSIGKYYIMIVENHKERLNEFFNYINTTNQKLIEWFDER